SFNVVSLIAIVPESECNIPTLIVPVWATITRANEIAETRIKATTYICLRFIGELLSGIRLENGLHLDLETDSRLPEIGFNGVVVRVFDEEHHARIELLQNVVKVEFRGLLVVVPVRNRDPARELRFGVLA